MLTREENELLTRVGPGTPMGEFFRRFWLPALLPEELRGPDNTPVRLRLLGEDLVAFRDTEGKVGILEAYCAHRGAHLFWGRNEECGLRCTYHGWKYDVEGNCVDMPNEPSESKFKEKVKIRGYPTRETGGVIWIYMGPKDRMPQLPELEWISVPDSHRSVSKWLQETNWLQGMEGEIDTSHISFLHSWLNPTEAPRRGVRPDLTQRDRSPKLTVKETDYGFVYGSKRDAGEGQKYWRVTQWLLPMYSLIPNPEGHVGGRAWVPIDDLHTFTFSYSCRRDRSMTEEERASVRSGRAFPPELGYGAFRLKDGYIIDTWRPKRNKDNDYLIDREMQRKVNFTGIYGVNDQDRSIQESMRSVRMTVIADRSREQLGTADIAIITARRCLLKVVRELQQGIEPYPAMHGNAYRVRALDVVSPEADFNKLLERYSAEMFSGE